MRLAAAILIGYAAVVGLIAWHEWNAPVPVCVASHGEAREDRDVFMFVPMTGIGGLQVGNVTAIPNPHYGDKWTETVCDRWETR